MFCGVPFRSLNYFYILNFYTINNIRYGFKLKNIFFRKLTFDIANILIMHIN